MKFCFLAAASSNIFCISGSREHKHSSAAEIGTRNHLGEPQDMTKTKIIIEINDLVFSLQFNRTKKIGCVFVPVLHSKSVDILLLTHYFWSTLVEWSSTIRKSTNFGSTETQTPEIKKTKEFLLRKGGEWKYMIETLNFKCIFAEMKSNDLKVFITFTWTWKNSHNFVTEIFRFFSLSPFFLPHCYNWK